MPSEFLLCAAGGRSRRIADIADCARGRLNWAGSALTGVASGRTGVRAKAAIPLRARNRLYRPKWKCVRRCVEPARPRGQITPVVFSSWPPPMPSDFRRAICSKRRSVSSAPNDLELDRCVAAEIPSIASRAAPTVDEEKAARSGRKMHAGKGLAVLRRHRSARLLRLTLLSEPPCAAPPGAADFRRGGIDR